MQSSFILGCWRLNQWKYSVSELTDFVYKVIELGINHFDHADIYGDYSCENIFGQVLKSNPILRDKIKLTSKCGIKLPSKNFPDHSHIYDTSFDHIVTATEMSLENLYTDYLDTLLIHRPDPLMNSEEVAKAFRYLHSTGKVLNFGVSNFTPLQTEMLQSYLDFPLHTNQLEASVLCHENFDNGNFEYLQMKRLRPQIWSPLAGGRVLNPIAENELSVHNILTSLASKYESTIENIAIAWLLQIPVNPQIILGSGKLDRLSNMLKSKEIILSKDEWFSLWVAYNGHDIP